MIQHLQQADESGVRVVARTDPIGRVFVSYSHTRAREVNRLVAALRCHGVPPWQDVHDLGPHSSEDEIRAILADPSTSGAVLWISPEVATSPFVTGIEVRAMVERARCRDGFYLQLVAAGGLTYAEAGEIASRHLGLTDLRRWNMHQVTGDPASGADTAAVARTVLGLRLAAIHERLDPAAPLTLLLQTRAPMPHGAAQALRLDWSGPFARRRVPQPEVWSNELEPALVAVAESIATRCHGRTVRAEGHLSFGAGAALGYALRETTSIPLTWVQQTDGHRTDWSLAVKDEERAVEVHPEPHDPAGTAIALLLSCTHSVEDAFAAFRRSHALNLRGVIHVTCPDDGQARKRMTAGQAATVARHTRLALDEMRTTWGLVGGDLHLFMAGPVGLAVLIGQLLNTWGPITVYEQSDDSEGYAPGLAFGQ